MRLIRNLFACLACLASGSALAIDPNDEDLSYLPAEMLKSLTTTRYGFDEATFKRCVGAKRKAGQDAGTLEKITDSCRARATPRKCRTLSPQPTENVSKSAQEICADACKAKGKFTGDCALN